MMPLRLNATTTETEPGHFVAMLNAINVDQPLSVLGISRDCIAIYGANKSPQEGATLLLYNTQFKVIESKQLFKVYFGNSRLWIVDTYIFLAVGQKLAAVSFRISKEQLCDILGSQRTMNLTSFVDTECINTDAELEEVLEFDKAKQLQANTENDIEHNGHYVDQSLDESREFSRFERQTFENVDNIDAILRSLQQYDIKLEINEEGDLLADMIQLKLSANVNNDKFENKTICALVAELERIGESEVAISNLLIPICIESNLINDLMACLRTYSNVSEKMIVLSLKHVLDKINSEPNETELWHSRLNAILSCSFETESMVNQIRESLSFDDGKFLLAHIFNALESNENQLEGRPQNNDSTDEDLLLIKWFSAIVDSKFHQFILSRDVKLIEKLAQWKEFIDNLLVDIQQTKTISAMMYNLIDGKLLANDHVASKWYSVEEVRLY